MQSYSGFGPLLKIGRGRRISKQIDAEFLDCGSEADCGIRCAYKGIEKKVAASATYFDLFKGSEVR